MSIAFDGEDMSARFLIARGWCFATHGLVWVHGWLDGLG